MIGKLLYLTYIPMEDLPVTGSSVRPQKMKEAFEGIDIEVKTFSGISNDIKLRKKVVSDIRKRLETWTPDACYIESSSGPLFYRGDVSLIRFLHRKGIPTSIFYRDAYWKYPEYSAVPNLSLKDKLKRIISNRMQRNQWKVIRNNIDLIYFPSETMAKEFDCPRKGILPPGGFIVDVTENIEPSVPLRFIFVGGAMKDHGTFLTLDAFGKLNASDVRAKLTYVCPKKQWDDLGLDKDQYREWLEVVHTSGDANLKPLYEKADVALLTAPRSFYRDFAVPIKIFEYMSYLKPVMVTDCTETARIVEENGIGWVVKDDVDSVAAGLQELCEHPEIISSVKNRMKVARENNLWINRAMKVVEDLQRLTEV